MFSAAFFLPVTAIATNVIITIIHHGYKNCNVTVEDMRSSVSSTGSKAFVDENQLFTATGFVFCLCAVKESYIVTVGKNIPL
jgi:hypothetical protein